MENAGPERPGSCPPGTDGLARLWVDSRQVAVLCSRAGAWQASPVAEARELISKGDHQLSLRTRLDLDPDLSHALAKGTECPSYSCLGPSRTRTPL